jgi:hypothetical protein
MKRAFRLIWEERGNPDNSGEGRMVSGESTAAKICHLHNALYPKYIHTYEEVKQTQTT